MDTNTNTRKILFSVLTEEDIKQIVLATEPKITDTKNWLFQKSESAWNVCVTDVENKDELHPDNFTEIVIDNNLDIYCQGHNFNNTKYRVRNLFTAYKKMKDIFENKL